MHAAFRKGSALLLGITILVAGSAASAQEFISFKPNKKGKTMFKVVSPEGAYASISGSGVHEAGNVPISADVEDDHFYSITVTWKGKRYTGKFEAQDGKEGIIAVPPSAFDETPEERKQREQEEKDAEDRRREHARNRDRPADKPKLGLYDAQPMPEGDFTKVYDQLKKKPDNAGRITRLKAVCKKDHFSVGQMLRVLGMSKDDPEKLDMLRAVRGCVADHANKGKIAKAFSSNDDKDTAVKILDEQE